MISAKPSKTRIRVITKEDGSIEYEAQYKRYNIFDALLIHGGECYVAFGRNGRAQRQLFDEIPSKGDFVSWPGTLQWAKDVIDMHIKQCAVEKARRKAYKKPTFIKYP